MTPLSSERLYKHLPLILLAAILVVAAALRWYGLLWDSGYLFHPDERQILMVASRVQVPTNPLDLFSASSSLNPHFFAYGSLPIYLLRLLGPLGPTPDLSGPWANDAFTRWALVGRWLSGLFSLGTLAITWLLGKRLYGRGAALLASSCLALTVLDVQLSHYYAVDTLLTLLVWATLYAAFRLTEGISRRWLVVAGACFGLALATKVTALPLLVPIAYALVRGTPDGSWRSARRPLFELALVTFSVFLVVQPYALIDWFTFGRDVLREALLARGWLDYPYTLQYAGTVPYIYQIWQSALWGLSLPLGLFAWVGAALALPLWWKSRDWRGTFLLSWALVYFLAIGAQYLKYPRYLLPLLPALYLLAARWLLSLRSRTLKMLVVTPVLAAALLYSLAFVSIYGREHPWLTVSRWVYQHVPVGSTIAVEQWDDALPVLVTTGGVPRRGSDYRSLPLPMYEKDDQEKLLAMADALEQADVVILASQRAYASVGRLTSRYPAGSRYYELLFSGGLGFEFATTASNNPSFAGMTIRSDPAAGLAFDPQFVRLTAPADSWDWGFADESLTVYDHPQPLVFVKTRRLSSSELYRILKPQQ